MAGVLGTASLVGSALALQARAEASGAAEAERQQIREQRRKWQEMPAQRRWAYVMVLAAVVVGVTLVAIRLDL